MTMTGLVEVGAGPLDQESPPLNDEAGELELSDDSREMELEL